MGVRPLSRPAVFLDRDGVINRALVRNGLPFAPGSIDELEILPGVPEALRRLKDAGFALVVVTNQPDVSRGLQSREAVEAINAVLADVLALDEIRVCYHDDRDGCDCRKPGPALLTQAPRYDLSRSVIVGDRWRDIEAGRRAGVAMTIFVDYGYDEPLRSEPDVRVGSLLEAVSSILSVTASEPAIRSIRDLRVKIFADGADLQSLLALASKPYIHGFTTNPTLMHKAGVRDYRAFAKEVLAAIKDRPISFEVLSDDFREMERQANEIAGWGDNVYVKIPITNTQRESSCDLIRKLSHGGVKVNATALMTVGQVKEVAASVTGGAPSCVSVFAGRIADTGRDPIPVMTAALEALRVEPKAELIWASPRELLNIIQADEIGCHIITVTHDILGKLDRIGFSLEDLSLDTVKMFHNDAIKAGFSI
jgi:transaldolase